MLAAAPTSPFSTIEEYTLGLDEKSEEQSYT
jgi:hypothetical protein